jgi:hypothetical protein
LKLKYDEALSNVAVKFQLAPLHLGQHEHERAGYSPPWFPGITWVKAAQKWKAICKVGCCRLNPVEARVGSTWFQRLKLRYDEPLSNFAFNFNLRHYSKGTYLGLHPSQAAAARAYNVEAGRVGHPLYVILGTAGTSGTAGTAGEHGWRAQLASTAGEHSWRAL